VAEKVRMQFDTMISDTRKSVKSVAGGMGAAKAR